MIAACLPLEELNAGSAQADGDFDCVFLEDKLMGRREKVPYGM